MSDREAPRLELGEQWLDIAQYGVASRRVAHMADGPASRQAVDCRRIREVIADQPLSAFRVEPHPVVGDDAGGLLAAVLQSVEAKRGDGGGVRMVKDSEDAALLAQPVAVGVEAVFVWRICGELRRCLRHCFGAGANGAFLLIKASSFCLSIVEPLDPAVELGFFCG